VAEPLPVRFKTMPCNCEQCEESEVLEANWVKEEHDVVNNPAHYKAGRTIEPLDVIIDWEMGFLDGQVLKYMSRWDRKGEPVENLRKARFYLGRLIEETERA
jgi:hypothetical protein